MKSFLEYVKEAAPKMKGKLTVDTSQYKKTIESDKKADFTFNTDDEIKTFSGLWPAVEKKAITYFTKKRATKLYLTDVKYK